MQLSASTVRPEDAQPLWVLGDQLKFMGSVDGGGLHVVDVKVPPGSGTPPHRHRSIEIFRVAEGEITFGIFGEGPPRAIVAGPGTVVTLPASIGHNYENRGAAPAVMTAIVETQMRDFFRDVGSPVEPPRAPPTPEQIGKIMAACRRHGIEMLAPRG